jgi:hypothetical protein
MKKTKQTRKSKCEPDSSVYMYYRLFQEKQAQDYELSILYW